ncbi:unnamed protein product [Ostreobium quekettii]|uniref:protein-serine/threonine phosphatase n=1 Tax=Ostreobium quekettii TaxID=121088 RepID=A0A8S1IW63_9CHLO|nr:unnamed protein product [Ostreobium quekettii]|eukprot:evm.model.scf_388.4 EVM.evm.TU.scf_388.4   scf_388:36024-38945(+)
MAGGGKQSYGGVQVDSRPSSDPPIAGGSVYSAFGAPSVQRPPARSQSPQPSRSSTSEFLRSGCQQQRPIPGLSYSVPLQPEAESCAPIRVGPTQSSCPPHGAKAVCGRRSKMEDAYAIRDDLFQARDLNLETMLPPQLPKKHSLPLGAALEGHSGMERSQDSDDINNNINNKNGTEAASSPDASSDSLHFFGVFDGHGGVEAARHCADRLHQNLHDAWKRRFRPAAAPPKPPRFGKSGHSKAAHADRDHAHTGEAPAVLSHATSHDIKGVFADAFHQTDDEFRHEDVSALVGSTAVIVLVGQRYYLVANCGDSRAVLCRAGQAHPLTVDHKPEREDEMARVEKAGGQVWFWNGARVMGVLAMSRAIGDRSLRPYVIPDPEVTIVPRTTDDTLIIIATDGLWDVVSDQEACTLAMKCLDRAQQKGATDSDAARLTATVLIRAAMDRGSRDNITVVVIDLRASKRARVSSDTVGQECLSPVQIPHGPHGGSLSDRSHCPEVKERIPKGSRTERFIAQ